MLGREQKKREVSEPVQDFCDVIGFLAVNPLTAFTFSINHEHTFMHTT